MNSRFRSRSACALAVALGVVLSVPAAPAAQAVPALAVTTGRVVLAGTSNIHDYTAETNEVRVVRAELAPTTTGSVGWTEIVKPDAIRAFEIAVPAASLHSSKDGLDKNMHKALKASEFPDITFRLSRIETGASGEVVGIDTLEVAGVAREVMLALTLEPGDESLLVKGRTELLMPDFGIAPPKAMLGMLKTDPKVTITFEVVLAAAAG